MRVKIKIYRGGIALLSKQIFHPHFAMHNTAVQTLGYAKCGDECNDWREARLC